MIDKSGSMSGAKMNNANEAAATVLDTLTEFDFASVVFFDSDIASSGGLRQATQSNVAELKRVHCVFVCGAGCVFCFVVQVACCERACVRA